MIVCGRTSFIWSRLCDGSNTSRGVPFYSSSPTLQNVSHFKRWLCLRRAMDWLFSKPFIGTIAWFPVLTNGYHSFKSTVIHYYQNLFSDKYVCLTVCLAGCKITHKPRTLWHIFTKFYSHVHFGIVQNPSYFQNRQRENVNFGKDVNDISDCILSFKF